MTEESDSNLVLRCQLGDRAAWESLVYRWHPRLWRFIVGMLGNRPASEDALQEAWLQIVRSLIRLREPDRLEAWMYKIARRVIVDRLREQYRRPVPEEFTDMAGTGPDVNAMEISDSLGSALIQLHPNDRECVVLYYFEGNTLDVVAGICDVPPGTIKSRLHRARCQLGQILKKEIDS
jgi:RNA polymerase sigma factor (sigma-70 family)